MTTNKKEINLLIIAETEKGKLDLKEFLLLLQLVKQSDIAVSFVLKDFSGESLFLGSVGYGKALWVI